MIDQTEYKRKTSEEWHGTKVRNLRPISNGLGSMPEGTIWTIKRKYDGFKLESVPCDGCGFQMTVRRVPPVALEVVNE